MKNYLAKIFWNYINAGRDRFYVEDPQVPFVNGFSLVLFLVITPFAIFRISQGDIEVGLIDLGTVCIIVANVIWLRYSLRGGTAALVAAFAVVLLALHVFYEGSIGGNTGIFWIYPIPVLMFFILGKNKGTAMSVFFFLSLLAITFFSQKGYFSLGYPEPVIFQAFLTFIALLVGVYLYADFVARNAQELEERTKSLREGFEAEKGVIQKISQEKEASLKEKLDIFFSATDELMAIADPKTGKFIEINPAATKILGFSKDVLTSTPFIDFVHKDDVSATRGIVEGLLVKGSMPANFINRYRKVDGTYTHLLWNSVYKNGLFYATAQSVDDLIAAQKKMEEKMKEVEDLNRLMVGREVRMAELKEELALAKQQGFSEGDTTSHL